MTARFEDLEHDDNPCNGGAFSEPHQLIALLENLRRTRSPFMCELVGDCGDSLTVGVGREIGCVQHARSDGTGPYLMAVDPATSGSRLDEMEFAVGGTPTPIDGRYCLSFAKLCEIVAEFVMTGNRSNTVKWEEF